MIAVINPFATAAVAVAVFATAGAAIVTATTQDGGKTASAAVTVADGSPTSVTGLTLDVTSLRVRRNRLYAVQAKVEPSTAANKQVRWSSDTPLVATVDTRGVIRTIRPGTAVMTALTVDGGFTATVLVIVF